MNLETGMEHIGVGDWVSGVTVMDEKFIGYVDVEDPIGIYRVVVTQSDRDRIIGKRVGARASKVRKLDDSHTAGSGGELESLIELALMTWDEAWFHELASRKGRPTEGEIGKKRPQLPVNRIKMNEMP
ncbi:hypothetical protein [Paenibacillus herberti]|uniref:IDEAL domain-containing protein n=1 Tax=Paenibacillus herberti TaxID=1619309 RepID=A0A229P5F5_9BACL|nr:hypothetical protein [Paenibacillus herberti]OXM17358.1 hypothetical protein CGZ75_12360 [Paenibacillus herberti]